MRVINIHKRKLSQPKSEIAKLFKTLATKEDNIWPFENWPEIHFKNGLKLGSRGGHGRVRYTIIDFKEDEKIVFEFTKPEGFIGIHEFNIKEIDKNRTEIVHEINMKTASFGATLLWVAIVRWLHDALIEDAFDKVENNFSDEHKATKHILWVKLLRWMYKKQSFKTKHA